MRSISRLCLVLLLGITLLPVAAGCSRKRDPSQPGPVSRFEEEMNGYVGGPVSTVLARFGVYTGMVDLADGKTLYEWNAWGLTRNFFTGMLYLNRCDLRVIVNADNLVESWNSQGQCR